MIYFVDYVISSMQLFYLMILWKVFINIRYYAVQLSIKTYQIVLGHPKLAHLVAGRITLNGPFAA